MFDAKAGAEQRMVDVGDIAGGEDQRVAGAERVVDEDAVGAGKTRRCGKYHIRADADGHEHRVGVEYGSVGQNDLRHPIGTAYFGDLMPWLTPFNGGSASVDAGDGEELRPRPCVVAQGAEQR